MLAFINIYTRKRKNCVCWEFWQGTRIYMPLCSTFIIHCTKHCKALAKKL